MPKRMSVSSTETINVPIDAQKLGVTYNPTSDPVYMAFLPIGTDPQDSDRQTAFWQTWAPNAFTTIYVACCLVGPVSGVVLAKARYRVWVKITDNPDVPWLDADELLIT